MKIDRGLAHHAHGSHPVLTIGNFDGQHKGHQALLRDVTTMAAACHGTATVLTFEPHPLRVLRPDLELRFLNSPEEKLARFREAGVQEVIVLEFTEALSRLSPEEFVAQILIEGIGVRELFVGEEFAFGRERKGRIEDLIRLAPGAGFRVHPVPVVRLDGETVSSSRIRRSVLLGDVRSAARCLGRSYALSGVVVHGEHRGRELGWPTANLRLQKDRAIPADGVYAAAAVVDGERHDAVAYIGTRPTFGSGERLLEVYLLQSRRDLYGLEINVEFVDRVRGDMTFATAEELSARIDRDVQLARESLRMAPELLSGS